jgi:mannosyltransferase
MRHTVLAPIGHRPGTLPDQRSATPSGRAATDWAVIVPAMVTLTITLWGITAPAYWADEADTVSAASRSLPQLIRLLGHVDAVHGLYYLLVWPVVQLAGPSEFATRLPSAVSMAAAAAGIAAIGGRIASRRVGCSAGLVFALLPVISGQSHNARPYGMVTAAAVLASYLLVRAVDDPRRRWLFAYGGALALAGYLELFALLLVPAHALALRRLARWDQRTLTARRWGAAVTGAALVVAPVVVQGWLQRDQISWIQRPGWADAGAMIVSLAGGSLTLGAVIWVLAAVGCARAVVPLHGQDLTPAKRLAWLTLPWLALPPVVMLAISQVKPVYNFRYVVFCVPAVALLAGAGLGALGRAWRAGVAVTVVALALPAQISMRAPGSGMREAARFLATHERPGDAIVYPGTGIPPWYLAYPGGFGRLADIGLARSPAASGRLYGVSVAVPVLKRREQHAGRIWVVQTGPWLDPAPYVNPDFGLLHTWNLSHGSLRIWLYGHHTGPSGARP